MTKRIAILAAFLLPLSATTMAQDQAPTLAVSYWKCDFGHIGEIVNSVDSLMTPIAQELVDEGELRAFGTLTHYWGDEWNLVFYWLADDIPAFLDAWDEMMSRSTERHPDMLDIREHCPEHKDNIYSQVSVTEMPSGM